MKVLPFNIPVAHDKTVIVQEEILPYFYPHLHRHEEIQITLIQKGEGTLTVGNKIHNFSANEVYIIGSNIPHVFKSAPSYYQEESKQTVHALTIYFNPRGKLSTLFNLPELKNIDLFFSTNYSGFRIPPHSFTKISELILSVKYTTQLEQLLQFFELLKSLYVLKNLSPLSSEITAKELENYDRTRMSNICSFITKNYHKNLTLDFVAEFAHLTPQAFCRYFKKHTRLTFISFLNEVRINEACKKLVSGGFDSVAAVAENCGYNNITNFNRVFKSVIGKSPSSYMKTFSN